ncbi:MAG: hypothetical protein GTO22_09105 [Gemmatimonadales bacterium]|nr:hypothetical protein [Gemmatimonadales bacterium]
MKTLQIRTLAGLFLIALSSCGREPPRQQVLVRDSAQVEIVQYALGTEAGLAAWELSPSPLLQIGAFEGEPEYQLYQATGATRLPDGSIVVANAGTHELRFYDTAGRFLQAVGQEGGGPGEFQRLSSVWRVGGDSLVTWDWGSSRLTFFDAAGRFGRTVTLTLVEGRGLPLPVGVLPDGQLLVAAIGFPSPNVTSGVLQDTAALYRCTALGEPIDSLRQFPFSDLQLFTTQHGPSVTRLPFGRRTQVGTVADGFFIGAGEAYEIRFYSSDGTLRRIVRREHRPRTVTDADVQRYKERRLATASEMERTRFDLERRLDETEYPATMPAYGNALVGRDDNLWVADYQPLGEGGHWTAFDRYGRMVAALETPPGFVVFEFGSDYVLGRSRDELDVERVQLYALVKG